MHRVFSVLICLMWDTYFHRPTRMKKVAIQRRKIKQESHILKYLPSYHKIRKENIFERNYDIARLI
ncbi:hypothetical protein pb186bvf_001666 [Paramecium bursaria]